MYSTVARPEARLTLAEVTPPVSPRASSTWRTQEAHVMPPTITETRSLPVSASADAGPPVTTSWETTTLPPVREGIQLQQFFEDLLLAAPSHPVDDA